MLRPIKLLLKAMNMSSTDVNNHLNGMYRLLPKSEEV